MKKGETWDGWLETEAHQFCIEVGFDLHLGYNRLIYAFVSGTFDGSLRQLAEIACGKRVIRNFGSASQQKLTYVWFKHLGVL